MSSKNGRYRLVIGCLLVLFVLTYYYYHLFYTVLRNSDNASIILQGQAMAEGNFFLKGWSVPPDSFWSIDIIFNALAIMLFGFNAKIMFLVPAFTYSAIIVFCMLLVKRDLAISKVWPHLLVVIIILGFPTGIMLNLVSRSPIHLGAFLYFLISLFLIKDYKNSKFLNSIILFILFLTASGDPYAIYIFVLPMIIVFIDNYFREKDRYSLYKVILLTVVIFISRLSIKAIHYFGGFYTHDEISVFVSLEKFPHNLYLTTAGILELFKANFFGKPLSISALLFPAIGMLFLLLVFYSIYKIFKNWKTTDLTSRILASSIVITIIAYLFSTHAIDLSTTRFLFPVIIFGSILMARTIPISFSWSKLLIVLFTISEIVMISKNLQLPRVPSPTAKVEQWLVDNDYEYGYAPFWSASIATVYSNNTLKIRPIKSDGQKYSQMNWLSDESWYSNHQGRFLIIDQQDITTVNLESATNFFGKPDKVVSEGSYTILLWNKDITPLLSKD